MPIVERWKMRKESVLVQVQTHLRDLQRTTLQGGLSSRKSRKRLNGGGIAHSLLDSLSGTQTRRRLDPRRCIPSQQNPYLDRLPQLLARSHSKPYLKILIYLKSLA